MIFNFFVLFSLVSNDLILYRCKDNTRKKTSMLLSPMDDTIEKKRIPSFFLPPDEYPKKNLVFCRSFYQDKYLFPRVLSLDGAEEVSGVSPISQSTFDINYLQHSAPMFQHDLNPKSNYAKIRFRHRTEVLVFHSQSLMMMMMHHLQWLCDRMKMMLIYIDH